MDFILRNYHDVNFALNMEFYDFMDLFLKSKERELERKVWEFWLVRYPTFTEEDFITYEEMLDEVKGVELQTNDDNETIIVGGGYYVDQVFF